VPPHVYQVTVLRGLQRKLAAALHSVNDGAGQLHLKRVIGGGGGSNGSRWGHER
jgi:hypothetical protein